MVIARPLTRAISNYVTFKHLVLCFFYDAKKFIFFPVTTYYFLSSEWELVEVIYCFKLQYFIPYFFQCHLTPRIIVLHDMKFCFVCVVSELV